MALALSRASRQLGRAWSNSGVKSLYQARRHFASVGHGKEIDTLPLSGIRVLDMTRVLAGVGAITRLEKIHC